MNRPTALDAAANHYRKVIGNHVQPAIRGGIYTGLKFCIRNQCKQLRVNVSEAPQQRINHPRVITEPRLRQ